MADYGTKYRQGIFSPTDIGTDLDAINTRLGIFEASPTGWTEISETWTYSSAVLVNVPTTTLPSTRFAKGLRVRLKQGGGYKYFACYAVGASQLSLFGGSDYTIANSAITDIAISYFPAPVGYPDWFNYSPTYAASGSMTFTSVSTNVARCSIIGSKVSFYIGATGTTGGTASTTITATAPITFGGTDVPSFAGVATDSGNKGAIAYLNSGLLNISKYDLSNWGLGASRSIRITGDYQI